MRLSPTLTGLRVYPFTRLTEAKRRLAAEGVEVVDFDSTLELDDEAASGRYQEGSP